MLIILHQLGYVFAEGDAVADTSQVGGGISAGLSRRDRLRLQIQQGIRKDDDEIIAVLVASGFFD